ncbi:MAG: tyrosine-type recombinase/integrase [Flavobacteriales bacterium]|nr:tyrosine-type recombinase/integrase [Flavobacteriales bacterium]
MTSAYLFLDTRRANKNGEYRIKLRIVHNRNSKEIKLKYSCKENQWAGNRVKNYPNSGRVNAYLGNELARANQAISENIEKIDLLSPDEVKELIMSYDPNRKSRESAMTLREWADVLIERKRKAGNHGTAKIYDRSVRSALNFWDKEGLQLNEIDITFLKDFEAAELSKGNTVNTISIYLKTLRAILNAANRELESYTAEPFKNFSIKTKKTKKRAVSQDIIGKVRELKFDKETREGEADWNAQNYFLFMFNNRGMNFVDLAKLKAKQIIDTKYKGNKLVEGRLIYTRSKNNKDFSIKLTDESVRILNDYKLKDKAPEDYVFPIGFENTKTGLDTYNQKRNRYNRRFRKIAKLIGAPEINLTTYVIRHTWASIAKRKGIPTEVIGESLGHGDLKTTEVYLDSFDSKVLDDANELIVNV